MRRLLSLLVLLVLPVLSQSSAQAADNPFVVKDVKVDATAASATEAFNLAVDQGRQEAWTTLIHRLTKQEDWARVPALDTATLQRMILGYQVSDERRSTTRYVAKVTYTFNAKLVRHFLNGANVAYADSAAPALLVIPMAPAYAPDTPWMAAWSSGTDLTAGAVPLVLPAADALNKSVLGMLDFGNASWVDVQPVAARAQAARAALVLASAPTNGQITVRIRILSAAPAQDMGPVTVPVPEGTPDDQAYAAAAQAAATAIANAWKAQSAVDFNHLSQLTADIRLESLAEWGTIQQRLAKVPVVTNVNVEAMNIGQARIVISYAGTQAQLGDFLSQAALDLASRNGVWWLSAQHPAGGVTNQP